jgi:biopolymer transport protein ExbD
MADFAPTKPNKGGRKRKIFSTRVDLTPMVDLGFLLITFFIFTTTMSEPKSMKIKMPADGDSSKTAASKTLSLLLGKNNELWYYSGDAVASVSKTDYTQGIRSIISVKKKLLGKVYGDEHELVVLIKPTTGSSFENIVDILDEMVINDVSRYVLMEPSAQEVAMAVN